MFCSWPAIWARQEAAAPTAAAVRTISDVSGPLRSFNLNASDLGPRFHGDDIFVIANGMNPNPALKGKSEFETLERIRGAAGNSWPHSS